MKNPSCFDGEKASPFASFSYIIAVKTVFVNKNPSLFEKNRENVFTFS
jgi:hypothetical protein